MVENSFLDQIQSREICFNKVIDDKKKDVYGDILKNIFLERNVLSLGHTSLNVVTKGPTYNEVNVGSSDCLPYKALLLINMHPILRIFGSFTNANVTDFKCVNIKHNLGIDILSNKFK